MSREDVKRSTEGAVSRINVEMRILGDDTESENGNILAMVGYWS